MHQFIEEFATNAETWVLLLVMVISIAVLGASADVLVDNAVKISVKTGLPKIIVGATIVSIGTTFPEAVVSVMAAMGGHPDFALGNAVGSIICDTGLILGIACLMSPLKLDMKLVNRQGWVQFGAAALLVVFCLPYGRLDELFTQQAILSQTSGFILVVLLLVYLVWSVRLARLADPVVIEDDTANGISMLSCLVILSVSCAFVILSSIGLIESTKVLASRAGVSNAVIAATVVAFGTSLPELVTAITAVRKGHGELAIGNIIGADILNVLFVAGLAAAVTPDGLFADPLFFSLQFPAMLFILFCFRVGIKTSANGHLGRRTGILLLGTYIVYLAMTVAK
ncbi:MAG: calcium/sodium antiporter [Planctomycetaceae bacterium]|jgi:cation:H+ antiporter|nr:calcium/sodium antiporter [Planctomycetaceae bacterium]